MSVREDGEWLSAGLRKGLEGRPLPIPNDLGPKSLVPVEAERDEDAAGVKPCAGAARKLRRAAGVEVGPVGDPGERGDDLEGDVGGLDLVGEPLGVAVPEGGVTGAWGNRDATGDAAGDPEGLRNFGRSDGRRLCCKTALMSTSAEEGPSASMMTALSTFAQSSAAWAGASDARIASITSRFRSDGEKCIIDASASLSGSSAVCLTGSRMLRVSGDGVRDDGDDGELERNIRPCLDTPELSASIIVDSS